MYSSSECGPVLTPYLAGNSHSKNYRLKLMNLVTFPNENGLRLKTEAFKAGTLLISIVEGDKGMHYFHVEDTNDAEYDEDTNRVCPSRRR